MTTREALMSVVETLDDEQVAQLLGYADRLAEHRQTTNGVADHDPPPEDQGEAVADELTNAVPRLGSTPGSSVRDIVGFIKSDGPTSDVPMQPHTAEMLHDEPADGEPVLSFSPGSPLWDLVGFIKGDGPTDMSTNKHTYLAEAYADLHEE